MIRPCLHCGSGELTRVHGRAFAEHVVACIGLYPYVCSKCRHRCLQLRFEQAIVCLTLVAFVVTTFGALVYRLHQKSLPARGSIPALNVRFPGGALDLAARTGPTEPVLDLRDILQNEEIIELSRAGLSSEIISQLIRKSPHRFAVDTKSLVALKRGGVKDQVIGLIIEVSVGTSRPAATGAPIQGAAEITHLATLTPPAKPPATLKVGPRPVARDTAGLTAAAPFGTLLGKVGDN